MKKLIMIFTLVVLAATFGSMAKADNPVTWDFSLESHSDRDDDGPLSPPIDTGWEKYDYSWVITDAQIEVMGGWYPGSTDSGSGSFGPPNPIPFTDETVYQHLSTEIDFDVFASVNSNGYGTISIDNIIFGQVLGNPVTGIKFDGSVTVTGVPEPATVLLLGLGALALLKKRGAKKQA